MPGNRINIEAVLQDKVSAGLDKIKTRLDAIGGKGTGSTAFGATAAAGFALMGVGALKAGQMIGDFVHDSIQNASNLNETLQKSGVVFGASAGEIEKFGKTAAASMGLSENAAVGAAATFGNLFRSMNIATDQIAPMSEKLVKLASDLASFNNIPVEDALAKLQSGIVGQERPLRELGVAISAASVDAEDMRLGFTKVNGTFTESQKVVARYNLILAQTSTAQGDFARTADQLANSQRTATAEMENASAELGKRFLPVQLQATKIEISFLQSVQDLADELNGVMTPAALRDAEGVFGMAGAAKLATETIQTMTPETLAAAEAMGLLTDAQVQAELSYRGLVPLMASAEVNAAKLAQTDTVLEANTKAASKAIAFGPKSMVVAVGTLAGVMAKDKKTVSDYYGTIVSEDTLAATNAQIAKDKRIIAIKAVSKEQKAARATAITDLHQAEADQAKELEDLATAGKTQSAAFTKGMESLLGRLKTAHGTEKVAIQAEIDYLKRLSAAALTAASRVGSAVLDTAYARKHPGSKTADKGAAEGGWVGLNGPEYRLVGERGPEYVIPNGGGGPGGTTLVVNTIWPPTPQQIREMARALDGGLAGNLGRAAPTLGRT